MGTSSREPDQIQRISLIDAEVKYTITGFPHSQILIDGATQNSESKFGEDGALGAWSLPWNETNHTDVILERVSSFPASKVYEKGQAGIDVCRNRGDSGGPIYHKSIVDGHMILRGVNRSGVPCYDVFAIQQNVPIYSDGIKGFLEEHVPTLVKPEGFADYMATKFPHYVDYIKTQIPPAGGPNKEAASLFQATRVDRATRKWTDPTTGKEQTVAEWIEEVVGQELR